MPDGSLIEEWAKQWGIPFAHPEFVSFFDHHRAKGTVFKDWKAGWGTWERNAQKFAARSARPPGLDWKAQQPEREGNPNPVSRRISLPAASEVVRLLPGESPLSRALDAALPARSSTAAAQAPAKQRPPVRPEMMDDQREAERQRQLAELKNTNGAHG